MIKITLAAARVNAGLSQSQAAKKNWNNTKNSSELRKRHHCNSWLSS